MHVKHENLRSARDEGVPSAALRVAYIGHQEVTREAPSSGPRLSILLRPQGNLQGKLQHARPLFHQQPLRSHFDYIANTLREPRGDVTPQHIFRVKRIGHGLPKPRDPTKLTLDVYYPSFRSQQMTIRERICTAIYSLYISARNIPTPKHKTIASLVRLLYCLDYYTQAVPREKQKHVLVRGESMDQERASRPRIQRRCM